MFVPWKNYTSNCPFTGKFGLYAPQGAHKPPLRRGGPPTRLSPPPTREETNRIDALPHPQTATAGAPSNYRSGSVARSPAATARRRVASVDYGSGSRSAINTGDPAPSLGRLRLGTQTQSTKAKPPKTSVDGGLETQTTIDRGYAEPSQGRLWSGDPDHKLPWLGAV